VRLGIRPVGTEYYPEGRRFVLVLVVVVVLVLESGHAE
jgi:hypothetical protein